MDDFFEAEADIEDKHCTISEASDLEPIVVEGGDNGGAANEAPNLKENPEPSDLGGNLTAPVVGDNPATTLLKRRIAVFKQPKKKAPSWQGGSQRGTPPVHFKRREYVRRKH